MDPGRCDAETREPRGIPPPAKFPTSRAAETKEKRPRGEESRPGSCEYTGLVEGSVSGGGHSFRACPGGENDRFVPFPGFFTNRGNKVRSGGSWRGRVTRPAYSTFQPYTSNQVIHVERITPRLSRGWASRGRFDRTRSSRSSSSRESGSPRWRYDYPRVVWFS